MRIYELNSVCDDANDSCAFDTGFERDECGTICDKFVVETLEIAEFTLFIVIVDEIFKIFSSALFIVNVPPL
ncbi:hypothetical protein TcBrA4_0079370 [Trypanosoma cruzi]|nr:hypothetical protein TcBrA4_0079370 [Trypanosoma cruzi]